jgi:hypothetical protein
METIEDIQSAFIRDMRILRPEMLTWWNKLMASDGETVVWRRWPTGFSGQPRVIATFRKYFFEIERHNEAMAAAFVPDREPPVHAMWGKDDVGRAPENRRPAEWLIFDIENTAPDIYDLVEGLCLIPIGMDGEEDSV